jgi:Mg2+ and Co2+ transporter CorA
MNFDGMPLVRVAYGYPMALGLIDAIALILTWYFYKRGWFS